MFFMALIAALNSLPAEFAQIAGERGACRFHTDCWRARNLQISQYPYSLPGYPAAKHHIFSINSCHFICLHTMTSQSGHPHIPRGSTKWANFKELCILFAKLLQIFWRGPKYSWCDILREYCAWSNSIKTSQLLWVAGRSVMDESRSSTKLSLSQPSSG